MKTKNFLIALAYITCFTLIVSCEDAGELDPELTGLADQTIGNGVGESGAHSMLEIEELRQLMIEYGVGVPLGAFYGGLDESGNGRSASHSPMQAFKSLTGASSANGRVAEDACYKEEYTEDENGNYTWVVDFGDGCDLEGEEFLKGKIVSSGTFTDNTFSDMTEYIGFGGEDWEMNGKESSAGTYTFGTDTTDWEDFSSTYEFNSAIELTFTEEFDEDSTGTSSETETISWKSSGKESFDEFSFTVESMEDSFEASTGEAYNSTVESPLVMNFECEEEDVYTFVSGIESGTYSYDGESGAFSLNYGDGSCDNIVEVTEDGETFEIDFSDEWEEDWEEECGDDHEEDGE
ncbi:MAG: hypothetical protein JXR03_17980 [Cyclobacteriaceae bacterium]